MNREFLEGLGLEKETVDKVMKEHGKTLNDTKEKADKVGSLENQIEDYKQQLTERDTQLEELKKVDAEGLQAKIDELQQTNETQKTEYENQLQQQAFYHKLESTLSKAKVKNTKAVKALLDTESIKLDGDKLLNLDDQLEALKESDAYLFEQEEQTEPPKPNFTTGQHQKGGTTKNIADMSYQELADLKSSNPTEFAELTK